jgi:CubicO group peptidase (beta-lactamase class C family)
MKITKNLFLRLFALLVVTVPCVCFGQENSPIDYRALKEYEGSYEYFGGTRLQAAASPRDNRLYAIINEVRYPLETVARDSFLDVQKTKVTFERDAANQITGYRVSNNFFKRLSKENFPANIWYPRYVADGGKFRYEYLTPEKLKDNLPIGSLSKTGLDAAAIKEMVEKIADETYKNIHSVLIVKDGKLVVEEYFYEYDRNKLHQLRSTTKSVISALVGIAVEKGFIKSVNETVLSFFPEYDVKNLSEDKKKITIENLLTNQSGLACDDEDKNSPGNEMKMGNSSDWVKFTLDLPMIDRPGNGGRYCSGGVIVLGKIVEKTTRKPLKDFAAEHLFTPLGVSDFKWNFKPDSSSAETFCQIYLTPRAMAKFGLLYLNGGKLGGKQIISDKWVKDSLAKHSVVNETDYGYLWWRPWFNVNGKRVDGIAAKGYGGQRIYLRQDLNMIAVITGGNYGGNSPSDELLVKYILPPFAK